MQEADDGFVSDCDAVVDNLSHFLRLKDPVALVRDPSLEHLRHRSETLVAPFHECADAGVCHHARCRGRALLLKALVECLCQLVDFLRVLAKYLVRVEMSEVAKSTKVARVRCRVGPRHVPRPFLDALKAADVHGNCLRLGLTFFYLQLCNSVNYRETGS